MNEPTVSIIVPLHDAELTIGATLESLRTQRGVSFEAIIIDDGSQDDGPALVRAQCEADHRFRMIHQPNAGLGAARNRGLSLARGRFVHFCDADDGLEPDGLARLVKAASAGGGAACGGARYVDERGGDLGWVNTPPVDGYGLDRFLLNNEMVVPSQILARQRLGDERFDPSLRLAADYDLWCRLALQGVRWVPVPERVCWYRLRAASLSRRFPEMLHEVCGILERTHAAAHAVAATFGAGRPTLGAARRRHGLANATAHAIGADDLAAESAALLRGLGFERPLESAELAEFAYWHVPYALCAAPARYWNRAEPLVIGRLVRFWDALVPAALAGPQTPCRAATLLVDRAEGSGNASRLAAVFAAVFTSVRRPLDPNRANAQTAYR